VIGLGMVAVVLWDAPLPVVHVLFLAALGLAVSLVGVVVRLNPEVGMFLRITPVTGFPLVLLDRARTLFGHLFHVD